jgi:hypothetical protein
MLAALAERLGEEVGGAVGDKVLLGKARGRGDKDSDLDDAADLLEVAERCLCLRQDVDGAEFRCLPAARSVDLEAKQPGILELAVLERQLTGGEHEVARPYIGQVVGRRRRGLRQHHAHLR